MSLLQPSDLADLKVVEPHQMFVQPFLGSGFTKSGLYLEYNQKLYPVLATVLVVGPEVTRARPGEIIVYHPGSFDWVHLPNDRSFATMDERAVLARVLEHETLEPVIEPVMENVLIKPKDENENYSIQIVRHRDNQQQASEGTVIAAGSQAKDVAVNDLVAYIEQKALVLNLGQEAYHLIGQRHIIGILTEAA